MIITKRDGRRTLFLDSSLLASQASLPGPLPSFFERSAIEIDPLFFILRLRRVLDLSSSALSSIENLVL